MSDVAIACHGLTKRYRRGFGHFTAVEGLDLVVPRGTTFGLLGPNGAGKTTTIQMVLGLVFPSSGSAEVLGGTIASGAIRRQVGFVPEKFQLPPFLSAQEFLEIHGRLFGLSGAHLQARVTTELERVGLASRRRDRVGGFSKGMQQRLVLAQALLNDPALLILDEPTSALDPVGRREVRALIREAHARGSTVILNSHLLSEVEAVCDQVAILKGGKLIKQGSLGTLAGRTLTVELRLGGWSEAVASALATVATHVRVVDPALAGGRTAVSCEVDSDDRLPALAAAVQASGAALYAMVPHGESLEDMFMRLVEETP